MVLEIVPTDSNGVKQIKDRRHKHIETAQVSPIIENNLNPVWVKYIYIIRNIHQTATTLT